MIENEIASGIRARATTRPASTSLVRMRGLRSASRTDGRGRYRSDAVARAAVAMGSPGRQEGSNEPGGRAREVQRGVVPVIQGTGRAWTRACRTASAHLADECGPVGQACEKPLRDGIEPTADGSDRFVGVGVPAPQVKAAAVHDEPHHDVV